MTKDDLKKVSVSAPRKQRTGTEVPTSRIVVFKASASLKQRINRHSPATIRVISDPDTKVTDNGKNGYSLKITTIVLATAFATSGTAAPAQAGTAGYGSVVPPSVGSYVWPSVGSILAVPT
jgi:hypothetical protein